MICLKRLGRAENGIWDLKVPYNKEVIHFKPVMFL